MCQSDHRLSTVALQKSGRQPFDLADLAFQVAHKQNQQLQYRAIFSTSSGWSFRVN
ncbi:hypothetical protein BDW60DRAFT_178966 [Aspergillus nidulans var. acristatus]